MAKSADEQKPPGGGARDAGAASSGPGGPAKAERDPGALVCPRCKHVADAAALAAAAEAAPPSAREPNSRRLRDLPRCPADGAALVHPDVLAEADGDPFLGATVADRFVILGKLGAGSMGTVYRARQEPMGRDVAIKILRSDRAFDAQAKARFTREARAMSLLTSPYTVTVFDFGEIVDPTPDADFLGGGSLYLAMELLEGESLGQRLKRVRRLVVGDAVRFARHALLSLAEAHDKGIIHRDLKPDNLFLATQPSGEEGDVCKVLDFGIAKVRSGGEKSVDALETQAGTVFGTPRYMSPEQAQGKPLDARSDLYSLGVLLYQMLVGRPPFVDDDAVVVMARHIKTVPAPAGEAAPDAGIPPALSALLQRVLAKEPADRPASAHEFIAELDRAAGGPAPRGEGSGGSGEAGGTGELLAIVGDDPEAAREASTRRVAARPRRVLVALSTVVVAVIAAAAFARGLGPPRPPPRVLQAGVARYAAARGEVARQAFGRAGAAAPGAPAPEGDAALAPAAPAAPAAAPGPAASSVEEAAPSGSAVGRSPAPTAAPKRPPPRNPYQKFD